MLTGDYENASAQIKTLNGDEPATMDFITLHEVLIQMRSEGRTLDSLTEKEYTIIQGLQGKQSPSGIAAENIIQHIDKTDIPEVFDAEEEDMRFANTETKTQITIYPNPTTGVLYIDLSQVTQTEAPVMMRMFSIIGKKVIEQNLSPSDVAFITINQLSTGIYLLSCAQDGASLHVETVVVE